MTKGIGRLPWTAVRSTALAVGLILFGSTANAQNVDPSAAEAALVQRVKDAVIKELRESGALDRAIDTGVERYIDRQRAEVERREQRDADVRSKAMRPVSLQRDHIRGNSAAPITLVEYSDFECPFCKKFHLTAKKLVDESGGKVRWVYRHFPLEDLHPVKAHKEAVAAECAAELGGNEAFWKFTDRFYELTPSNNRTDIETVMPQIGREIGLNAAKLAACRTSGKHDERVREDVQNAIATGGRGTPWSLVVAKNGKVFPLSGAQPYAVVKQLVDLAASEK